MCASLSVEIRFYFSKYIQDCIVWKGGIITEPGNLKWHILCNANRFVFPYLFIRQIIFCGPEDNVKNPFEKVTVDDAVQETESDNKHEKYAEERYGKRWNKMQLMLLWIGWELGDKEKYDAV